MSGLDEIEVGQVYFGSIVTIIKQEVADTDDKYHIKRWVTLKDSRRISEEYWKEKLPNSKVYESGTQTLDSDYEYDEADEGSQSSKDDSIARAKAREMMRQRRKNH